MTYVLMFSLLSLYLHQLRTQQQEQVLEEDRYRDLFANHRSSSELSDPHLLLHDLFANNASYVYQEEDPDEV